jgi:hypothetical protein
MATAAAAGIMAMTATACAHGAAQAPLANKADGAHGAASAGSGAAARSSRTYVRFCQSMPRTSLAAPCAPSALLASGA